MSDERQNRSDRLKRQFDKDRNGNQDETGDATSKETGDSRSKREEASSQAPTETDSSEARANSSASIKDRPSVLMYLPEDLHSELDIRFDELNARYKREYGRPLEKNRDYYPAVVKASLEGETVEDILGV